MRPLRIFRTVMLLLTLTALAGVSARAQHTGHKTTEKKATLMRGLGHHHHPVSTKNALAQKFFDQGLTLIYGFNHEEAARSFRRAAELDPALAMAWWGYALAVGPNYNEPTIDPERMKAAYEATQKALALAGGAADNERGLITALGLRFTLDPKPDGKKLGEAYSAAMRDVYQRFPDDLDAATLYADSMMNVQPWQLWSKEGAPLGNTEQIVATLEAVLKRDPAHIGANHLYIHAVEASRTPERALSSADRLGGLVPAAGHLVHMPGHIYLRTGDYAASARVNVQAAGVDRAYIRATGNRGMYSAMYFSHNIHFQVESYNRAGQYAQAVRAAAELMDNVRRHYKAMPMVEGFMPSPIFVRLRFGKWNEILKMPEPDKAQMMTHTVWVYARGVAAAATGDVSQAEQQQRAFAEILKNMPGETPFGLNTATSVLKIAEHSLAARIAWAKGDKTAAIAAWRAAVTAEDALNYDEPPGWYYPVRESLGAALLRNHAAAAAEAVFREDLVRNPRNGRSLFGLQESLRAQNKTRDAMNVEREFRAAWRHADTRPRIADM
ncbi:MAG: tetratricopeptide repeat protein [Blastocatellia bacterium]